MAVSTIHCKNTKKAENTNTTGIHASAAVLAWHAADARNPGSCGNMVVVVVGDGSAQGNGCVEIPAGVVGQNGNGEVVAGGDGIPDDGSMSATTQAADHSDTTATAAAAAVSKIGRRDGIFALLLERICAKRRSELTNPPS
uniref:DUF834 domain-containing protein n=1 Tax=Oryza meridionalis TaxID=40149 RepID=A0A0E0BVZ7_9ORYZ